MHRYLLFLIAFFTAAHAGAQWGGTRAGLGSTVNDAGKQLLPVFGLNGDTLYFSEAATGSELASCYSTRAAGGWTPKQKHPLLNPQAKGNKLVYTQLCSGQFLINGHFRQVSRYMYQTKGLAFTYQTAPDPEYLSLSFSGADTMNNSRITGAHLLRGAGLLFLSIVRAGNEDLYVSSPLNPGEDDWGRIIWGSPQKLSVSTPFAETAPWTSPDGATLYFASDRPGGLGGFDIWSCTRNGAAWTDWTVPRNLKAPVNSKGNELSFTIDPRSGDAIFVSDEGTVGGTDIFRLQPAVPAPQTAVPPRLPDSSGTPLDSSAYKPSNIVFLLDLSNSMKQQRRMALLKAAMKTLVRSLRPVDQVSLYRFGDHLARLYVSQAQTENGQLLRIVDSLRSQGEATNGSAAIDEGYREALRKLLPGGNNQVFLVTDGDFPVFPSVEKMILETFSVQLTVVMIDESPEGQRLLHKFRRYPNVQIVTLTDVQRDAAAMLRNVQGNARK